MTAEHVVALCILSFLAGAVSIMVVFTVQDALLIRKESK